MFYLLSQFENSTCTSGNGRDYQQTKGKTKTVIMTVSNALNVKLNVSLKFL